MSKFASINFDKKSIVNFCKENNSPEIIKIYNRTNLIREIAKEIINDLYEDKISDPGSVIQGLSVILNSDIRSMLSTLYEKNVREIIFNDEKDIGGIAATFGMNVAYRINEQQEEEIKEEEKGEDENREERTEQEEGERNKE